MPDFEKDVKREIEKVKKSLKEIEAISLIIVEEDENYERYFDYLGNETCIKKFAEKKSQDELIIRFFNTLKNAYNSVN